MGDLVELESDAQQEVTEMKSIARVFLLLFLLTPSFAPVSTYAQGGGGGLLPEAPGQDLEFEHITVEQGLSEGTITRILQDSRGFMWFCTADGLNRYDGYTFTVYRHNPDDPYSLSSSDLNVIYEDTTGALWIGTNASGLERFDRATEQFTHYAPSPDDPKSLIGNIVWAIYQDRSGVLWVGTNEGLNKLDQETGQFTRYTHVPNVPSSLSGSDVRAIYEDSAGVFWVGTYSGLDQFDRATGQVTARYRRDPADSHSLSSNFVEQIYEDAKGNLWVGTRRGLNQLDRATGQFKQYLNTPTDPHSLSHNSIRAIFEDSKGVLWVGTDDGLNMLDRDTEQFTRYYQDPADPQSLSSRLIQSIAEDRTGAIWIGTFGNGVNRLDRTAKRFALYTSDPNNPQGLSSNNVTSVYRDREGNLWIGTNGGGLDRIDSKSGRVTHYRNDPNDPQSLGSNVVTSIVQDQAGALWVAAFHGGLNRLDPATGKLTRYRNDPNDPASLADDDVWTVWVDRAGTLWIGTSKGLNRFDPTTNTFVRYQYGPKNPYSLSGDDVRAIFEDSAGSLWIGTMTGGLNQMDRTTDIFTRFQYNPNAPRGLSSNQVNTLYQDSTGNLWIGTSAGLDRLDAASGTFVHYRRKDGLPDDNIQGILEDDQGNLWLSTNGGLAKFNLQTETFKNYDVRDGLQGAQFNLQSAFKSASGEMFFGGPNGLNAFFPDQLADNPYIPNVVLTGFQLFDRPVPVGAKGSPLQKHINEADQIILPHDQSTISIGFAALNYRSPDKNQYAYKLEGFDRDWNYVDSTRRLATYTNLPPGDYVFRVRASNNDGIWNNEGKAIPITITPPFWQTGWAYGLYALLGIGLVTGIVYVRTRAQARELAQKERELARERRVTERLQRLDQLKDEFLANTSHELRTPLHGIIGLAESLIDGVAGDLPEQARFNLSMVVSGGKRLANLVNDVLDFSKLKHGEMALKLQPVDVKAVADVVLAMSQPLLGSKPMRLVNAVPTDLPLASADENRVHQILNNLVGNAIKFTERGTVTVSATVADGSNGDEGFLSIAVTDTGIGIPADELDRIFESFEQAGEPTAPEYGGTGLGLPITRQLVELHGGQIWVVSTEGQGSTFTFTLPISRGDESVVLPEVPSPFAVGTEVEPEDTAAVTPEPTIFPPQEGPHILVVDDEPINLQVLGNYLSLRNYRVTPCMSGSEALAAVEREKPDLVLLDVMMPRMSGYEVSRKLRETYSLSELPILMLTVKGQTEDLVAGFEAGANDYLTKPFGKEELLVRVDALLALKQSGEALRESEDRLKLALESANDGLYDWNMQTGEVYFSPRCYTMLGYEPYEMPASYDTWINWLHPDDREYAVNTVNKYTEKRDSHEIEFRLKAKSGGWRWILSRGRVTERNVSGRPIRMVGTHVDITERKRAEEEIRALSRFREVVIDNAMLYLNVLDKDANILVWNKAAEEITDYSREEVVGHKKVWEWLYPDPMFREATFRETLELIKSGGTSEGLETEIRTRDGQTKTIAWYERSLLDDAGEPMGSIAIGVDVTQRKRAEEEIRRLNEELEQRVIERTAQLEAANKELEAFAYSVSHDLRAPLRHIAGFVRLLLECEGGQLDATSERYLNIIAESSHKMDRLIDDLLAFSRTGRAEMQVQRVELNELVGEAQQELVPEMEGRRIIWEVSPLLAVEGDPTLLRQVWVNLLSNAIKFTTPRLEARIEIGVMQQDTDRSGEVTVFIRDNGVGFDPQYAHKLFGVFQRLHREEEFEGTGIGLATVRRIIHRHGGRVWAEGELNRGATFYFTLREAEGE